MRPGSVGRVRRAVNRAVSTVLRSRAHRLLSGALLLATFRGRRSGRMYSIPLLYARDGDDLLLVALHPGGQQWWRNARGGAEVELLLRRRRLHARAEVEPDSARARGLFAAARPWARPALRRARGALFVRLSGVR
jgi:deazaflavin-dependent oxidoreductase (nitroreductase family)